MAIEIEVVGEATTLTTTQNDTKLVTVTSAPVDVVGETNTAVVIEILKGAPGDQNVYAGPTPPDNPQEGWIWIDTSG